MQKLFFCVLFTQIETCPNLFSLGLSVPEHHNYKLLLLHKALLLYSLMHRMIYFLIINSDYLDVLKKWYAFFQPKSDQLGAATPVSGAGTILGVPTDCWWLWSLDIPFMLHAICFCRAAGLHADPKFCAMQITIWLRACLSFIILFFFDLLRSARAVVALADWVVDTWFIQSNVSFWSSTRGVLEWQSIGRTIQCSWRTTAMNSPMGTRATSVRDMSLVN